MPDISSLAEQLVQGGSLGAFEPQRQNNWFFLVQDIGGRENEILLALDEGFLPAQSNEEIAINVLNKKLYVAGPRRYEAGSLVLRDYVDRDIAGLIENWQSVVYTGGANDGRVGLPADYKRTCVVQLFGPDGTALREWELDGCWPTSVKYGSLDMKSSDQVKIEVTIRYDEAVYLSNNGSSIQTQKRTLESLQKRSDQET